MSQSRAELKQKIENGEVIGSYAIGVIGRELEALGTNQAEQLGWIKLAVWLIDSSIDWGEVDPKSGDRPKLGPVSQSYLKNRYLGLAVKLGNIEAVQYILETKKQGQISLTYEYLDECIEHNNPEIFKLIFQHLDDKQIKEFFSILKQANKKLDTRFLDVLANEELPDGIDLSEYAKLEDKKTKIASAPLHDRPYTKQVAVSFLHDHTTFREFPRNLHRKWVANRHKANSSQIVTGHAFLHDRSVNLGFDQNDFVRVIIMAHGCEGESSVLNDKGEAIHYEQLARMIIDRLDGANAVISLISCSGGRGGGKYGPVS